MKFYVALASALAARNNCSNRNMAIVGEWDGYIAALVKDHAPSGSDFDNGTTLDMDATNIGGTKPQRLVFTIAFRHMDGNGFYDGWTEHQVWVYPWFDGLDIRVTGRNRNDVKEYITDTFYSMAAHDAMSFADYRAKVTS